jgi:tetratricopeptide (TPR) repeat protein
MNCCLFCVALNTITCFKKFNNKSIAEVHHIRVLLFLTVLNCCIDVQAQNVETDSLKKELAVENQDEKRVYILESLSYAYLSSSPDTALQYALQGLQLAQNIEFLKGEAICTNAIGNVYFQTGDNAKALEMYLHYLKMKEDLKELDNLSVAYFNIAGAYTEEEDYEHALYYLFKARSEDEKAKDSAAILYDNYSLGTIYLRMLKTDSALYYTNESFRLANYLDYKNMIGALLNNFGEIYLVLNDTVQAEKYYQRSLPYAEAINDYQVLAADYFMVDDRVKA